MLLRSCSCRLDVNDNDVGSVIGDGERDEATARHFLARTRGTTLNSLGVRNTSVCRPPILVAADGQANRTHFLICVCL